MHVLVRATSTAEAADGTVLVTILGYSARLNRWYVLGQLNGGAVITPTTKTGLAEGTGGVNTNYAEDLDHVSVWDRLYPMLTSIGGTGQSVSVDFVFEGS